MKISKDSKYNFGEKNSIYQAKDMVSLMKLEEKKSEYISDMFCMFFFFQKLFALKSNTFLLWKCFIKNETAQIFFVSKYKNNQQNIAKTGKLMWKLWRIKWKII